MPIQLSTIPGPGGKGRRPPAARWRGLKVIGNAPTVDLLEGGHLAAVQGNALTATFGGDFPKGTAGFPRSPWWGQWRNWCGGRDVSVQLGSLNGYQIVAKDLRQHAASTQQASTLTLPTTTAD
jgi:hypothetical protein